MRLLIAGLLTAALVWLIPSPAHLNNSVAISTKVQAVQAESPRQEVAKVTDTNVGNHQEKAPTEQPVAIEPEKTVVATPQPVKVEKPAPQLQGCESYRSLIDKYAWNTDIAMAVMHAESGCNPDATSQTCDRGLMQVNCIHSDMVDYNLSKLFDPATNIQIAYRVYLSQGWRGWSTFTNGAYLKFL